MIVIDHYIGGPLGKYLGETFIVVFFCISALLLGLKWDESEKDCYSVIDFLWPRIKKLTSSYYPFIFISLALLNWQGDIDYDVKDILLNFMYLSWFAKLPHLGHLWFLTMIVICYLVFPLLTKTKHFFNFTNMLVLLVITIALQVFFQSIGLPGYIFLIIFYTGILFLNSEKYLAAIRNSDNWQFFIMAIINYGALMYYFNYYENIDPLISKWLGSLSGLTLLSIMIKCFLDVKDNKIIAWLSSISYEIYLVHFPLLVIKPYLNNILNDNLLSFSLYLLVTLILAYFLSKIGSTMNRVLIHKWTHNNWTKS